MFPTTALFSQGAGCWCTLGRYANCGTQGLILHTRQSVAPSFQAAETRLLAAFGERALHAYKPERLKFGASNVVACEIQRMA
jgi:hypothetical protein